MLLKPPPLVIKKKGDPEQLLKDWDEYVKVFKEFLAATEVAGAHANPEVANTPCATCIKSKNMLRLVGGDEVRTLFDHVGMVVDSDDWKDALKKVSDGIKLQTNQAAARYKLMQKLPQNDQCFAEWFPKVKEQASRCNWAGYDEKKAARDAILFQTEDKKLQQKIMAEDLSYENTIKYGLSLEQGRRKVDEININRSKKEDCRVAKLEEQVRQLQSGRSKTSSCQTCTRPTHGPGECPGKRVECFDCGLLGHFKGSAVCKKKKNLKGGKKKKVDTRKVEEPAEDTDGSDTDSIGRVTEVVRAAGEKSRATDLKFTVLDHGRKAKDVKIQLLIDSGVHKTLLSEEHWSLVKASPNTRPPKLKKNKVRFVPFGTKQNLPILGRTKCTLQAKGGACTTTIVYVVKGAKESLLGLRDGEALGIIKIQPEGETVRQLDTVIREKDPADDDVVSGNQTQAEIDRSMEEIVSKFPKVFKGLGRATKVPPIQIEVDPSFPPVQQKLRPIPIHYKEKLKKHLQELVQEGVVTPLQCENGTGWIHNVVITAKKWSADKIRMNLDTRPMKQAVKVSHFHIPTPQELRHEFQGSDRFTCVDFNHAFHQFPMTEESANLFTFHTPWGLHRLNTLVMGTHSGSSELQERVRVVLEGLEGVTQIKDDVVIHGQGTQHDENVKKFLARIEEHGLTLRKEKCKFGVREVMWFGMIYSKQGMRPDPAKVQLIKEWPRPQDKSGVKSFLQTVQFCQVFMRPGQGRTYADVTLPLRRLTAKSVRFAWTKECADSFEELKKLLVSDKVMAYYDPSRPTRLYVDEGPAGVAATVAQEYNVDGVDHPVWRPVHHTSRAKTKCEQNYGKVDGESLGLLTGIKSNRMFLYGTSFTVVVDHEPLVSLYNSHSREVTVRVAKHKSKLLAFDFKVIYQPGATNPCDFASRSPPSPREYTEEEKEELGIEEEDEDREVLVCRQEELTDAVTLPILQRYTQQDKTLSQLVESIKTGRLQKDLASSGFKECFHELSVQDGIVMRGDRIVIPRDLRPDVLEAAHLGHPGKESMIRQLRLSTWWPNHTADAKQFEESCLPCVSAVDSNKVAPMQIRETPDRPWQHCSADYKGPIAGKYYFHVLIDNYSRWPEVAMVKSTAFNKLEDKLEESFGVHGIPDSITHDNGPCYNSSDWTAFAKKWGFDKRPCTPEHPQANGIAERFMGVLVKVVHTAVASGRDPRVEVRRRLLNYRNTPHPSTGKSPAELMIRRQIKTLVPSFMRPTTEKVDKEAKATNNHNSEKRKERYDKKRRVKEVKMVPGDRVLIKQRKTTVKPPYDPKPYTVVTVQGTQVTARRGAQEKRRNKMKMKIVPNRPDHLQQKQHISNQNIDQDSDDDEVDINLPPSTPAPNEDRQQPNQEDGEPRNSDIGLVELDLDGQVQEPGLRRSGRQVRRPDRYDSSNTDSQPSPKSKMSPRQRKRAKSCASRGIPREQWMIWKQPPGLWEKHREQKDDTYE